MVLPRCPPESPSRSTLSVLRTARRPLSDGSGGVVRFAEIKEMPEAVRAVERETDVVDGAPSSSREGDAARRRGARAPRRTRTRATLDADADFTCPNCGFTVLQPELPAHQRGDGRCRDEQAPHAYPPIPRAARAKSVALAQIVTQARARGLAHSLLRRAPRDVGHHGDYGASLAPRGP